MIVGNPTGAVVLLSLAAIYFMGRAAIDTNHDLLRYHIVIGELQGVLSTLKDAETGQRGYLLTGRENYLQPYNEAGERIHQGLQQLDEMAREGALTQGDIAKLSQLASEKLNELQQTILTQAFARFAGSTGDRYDGFRQEQNGFVQNPDREHD